MSKTWYNYTMLFYRILRIIAILVALALFGGTMYGLFFRPSRGIPPQTASPSSSLHQDSSGDAGLDSVFSGLGRIRSVTAGDEGAAVVLSVAFPYNSRDTAFSEELASRIPDFRAVTQGYFGSQTLQDLKGMDEETIKGELLLRFNQMLRLGSISALYFSEYMIIE